MNAENIKKIFVIYPFLNNISSKLNGKLEQYIIFKELNVGEFIKMDNAKCSNIVLVLKGKIKIEKIDLSGKQTSLYELGEGEVCHESLSCYMKCEALDLIGYALTKLEIALIPIKEINQYIVYDVDFLRFMYTTLYDKFRKVILDKEEIIHESIPARLIKYLKSKNTPIIYITHQEIAKDLSTAREVVSRNLKMLEKDGLIKLERNKIRILNL